MTGQGVMLDPFRLGGPWHEDFIFTEADGQTPDTDLAGSPAELTAQRVDEAACGDLVGPVIRLSTGGGGLTWDPAHVLQVRVGEPGSLGFAAGLWAVWLAFDTENGREWQPEMRMRVLPAPPQ